ncbi:MAG: 4Fe-4S dicluster domain-containing protein [Chloroflexota bacterium]
MRKDEIKKGRSRREDWPDDLYWQSGTYREKDGKPRLDHERQGYPGQPSPPPDAPDETYSPGPPLAPDSEPWFSREPSWHDRDAQRCREYLDSLSDDEILTQYYELRDHKVAWGGGYFYPNIQKLFLTPFEREKDRRETAVWQQRYAKSEAAQWYDQARDKSCLWWLDNHLIAKHALNSCMSCGTCTAGCPAAEFYDYDPRLVMETVQSRDEDRIVELLKADTIWYCAQCGTCKLRCPRGNNPFGLISSLRQLSQIKGYHVCSARGRQQYTARHLWGGNFWNRACCLYFRNTMLPFHLDFGPRFARYTFNKEEIHRRVGGCPDMDGSMPGRKVSPETLHEVRRCWQEGGTLSLWDQIERYGQEQAQEWNMDIDDYFYRV